MDTVINFFLLTDNRVFLASATVLGVLFTLELLGLIIGASLSHAINASLDSNHNGVPDFAEGSAFGGVFNWLGFGKIPATMVFALFLGYFAIAGLSINWFTNQMVGFTWPPLLSAPFAVILAMLPLRVASSVISRVMPKDFSSAVSVDELVGQRAVITTGTATAEHNAEARVVDRFNETHYVRVKPIDPTDSIPSGTQVYLDKREAGYFLISRANQE
jgi:hypothetical protein